VSRSEGSRGRRMSELEAELLGAPPTPTPGGGADVAIVAPHPEPASSAFGAHTLKLFTLIVTSCGAAV
jgi:hypothetical protein